MFECVYHKVYDYICQKLIAKNSKIFPNGIVEINPQLINDCLIRTHRLEHRINRLNDLAIRIRIKERLFDNAISQCQDIMKEVFPLLDMTMTLIKQSIEYNQPLEGESEIILSDAPTKTSKRLLPESKLPKLALKDGAKASDVNKMLIDTFYKFKKKRDDMGTWLTQIKNNPSLHVEA